MTNNFQLQNSVKNSFWKVCCCSLQNFIFYSLKKSFVLSRYPWKNIFMPPPCWFVVFVFFFRQRESIWCFSSKFFLSLLHVVRYNYVGVCWDVYGWTRTDKFVSFNIERHYFHPWNAFVFFCFFVLFLPRCVMYEICEIIFWCLKKFLLFS